MDKDRIREVLKMIKEDIKNDIKENDGKPFTGKNVGEMFGKQGAAIDALANIIEKLLDNPKQEKY